MNSLAVVGFILWLYVLSVLKRGKLHFWYFVWGSVGLFIFLMLWIQPYIVGPLSQGVTAVAGLLGQLTGLYQSNFQYGMLFIQKGMYSISLYIDFECAGVIETLAFMALLWFFPAYEFYEKLVLSAVGTGVIFIANIVRIFLIASAIYYVGNKAYYFAHTILGRIVFYVFSIILYYCVFTKAQIKRQKVGNFKYDNH